MKVYRIIWNEYVETEEYIGGPTYNLEEVRDYRLFETEAIAKQYAEHAKSLDGSISDYRIEEQEVINKFNI